MLGTVTRRNIPRSIDQQVDGIREVARMARVLAEELSELHTSLGLAGNTVLQAGALRKQTLGHENQEYSEFSEHLDQSFLRSLAYIASLADQSAVHSVNQLDPEGIDNRSALAKLRDALGRTWDDILDTAF